MNSEPILVACDIFVSFYHYHLRLASDIEGIYDADFPLPPLLCGKEVRVYRDKPWTFKSWEWRRNQPRRTGWLYCESCHKAATQGDLQWRSLSESESEFLIQKSQNSIGYWMSFDDFARLKEIEEKKGWKAKYKLEKKLEKRARRK